MTVSLKLSSPKQLTREIHLNILLNLRSLLNNFKQNSVNLPDNINSIRIRNWLFLVEEGTPTVDVVLDKVYSGTEVADTKINFTECYTIHEFLINSEAFADFADHVEIRCGTPGSEPTLYDDRDFKPHIGDMIRLTTWEPLEGRSKFTMILVEFFIKEGNSIAVLAEGSQRFEIPIAKVREAFALPFHPASKSMKLTKKKPAPKKHLKTK